ncbi:IS110 family transposase [Nitrosomonas sp.]|uniref:IS110 family transposase n=1 Tax=Nitrosomonas sp. TaxID=42353 RepID=UPI002624A5E5|nr:IS110 family transposase [Nitrosomonas sp.]
MNATTYGLDIAKRVFQLYWVEHESGEIHMVKFGKQELLEFFAQREAGLIAMEACGSAHWWRRKLMALGHEVRLIHAKFVRPFVQGNKTDAADAKAIWTAVRQPGMRTVAGKTEDQQAMLALHRMRLSLIKFRTMQVNQLRGLLYEFGVTLKGGRQAGLAEIIQRMAELEEILPGMLFEAVKEQLKRLNEIESDVQIIERRIKDWQKQQAACRKIAEIPGVGMLTATALVATMGEANCFKSGREFAAFVGLVPRQSGTGGKVKLLGISKRGDTYLRTLLIHGARTVMFNAKDKGAWSEALLHRRPTNVAIVAMANKMARTAWAILAHDRKYQRSYVSQVPA